MNELPEEIPEELPEELPEDLPPPPPVRPVLILTAGGLWVLVGAFFLLMTCLGTVLDILLEAGRQGPVRNSTAGCAMQVNMLIWGGFLTAGIRTLQGKAKDTVITSVMSILVGLLYFVIGAVSLWLAAARAPGPFVTAMLVTGALSVLLGGALFLPAVLALAARSQYLEWRKALEPPRRRRTRRRREEQDEERDWERPKYPRDPKRPWNRARRDSDDDSWG